LVVVGKRPSSPLAQFFTGSVAQRLAKWAAGDVLIAPLDQLSVATTEDLLC
jgi:nucleotide-binding universal stress UspA family protein